MNTFEHLRNGSLVWFEQRPGKQIAAVVCGELHQLGGGHWIVPIQCADTVLDVAVGRLAPREESPAPLPPPERAPSPMTESHTIEWTVRKIEDKIGAVRITLAPEANDDAHCISFDVTKETAAQYAVGGKHTITVGPRTRFGWESPPTDES